MMKEMLFMVLNLGHVVGTDGKGIQSIVKTSTSGLVDTYTITYTNGDTTTFTVTNGAKGDKGDHGDPAQLVDEITDGDTTHAPTANAVYDYIATTIGDIQDYVNQ